MTNVINKKHSGYVVTQTTNIKNSSLNNEMVGNSTSHLEFQRTICSFRNGVFSTLVSLSLKNKKLLCKSEWLVWVSGGDFKLMFIAHWNNYKTK
jgi:hypothetical protein